MPRIRTILIAIATILLIAAISWAWGRSYIGSKIEELIAKANEGSDSLSIESYSYALRPFAVDLQAKDISLIQTSAGGYVSGHIDSLELLGVSLFSLFSDGPRFVNRVNIIRPSITDSLFFSSDADSVQADSMVEKLFELNYFEILDADYSRLREDREQDILLKGLSARNRKFSYPIVQGSLFDELSLQCDSIILPGKDHDLKIVESSWRYDSTDLEIELLELSPKRSAIHTVLSESNPAEWLALRFDGISLADVNPAQWLDTSRLYAPSLNIKMLNAIVSAPVKPLPAAEQVRNMPVQSLREIDFPFTIDEIRIADFDIEYQVISAPDSTAKLRFYEGEATIKRVSNSLHSDSMQARIHCAFHDMAPLEAYLSFSYADERSWQSQGTLGECSLVGINPFLELAADANIKQGYLERLSYRLKSDGRLATGSLLMPYEDLRIELVGNGAWFKNIMKGILFKNHNKPPDIRKGTIYHEHELGRSFFNLWWKSILTGLKSSTLGDVALPSELR